MLAVVGFLGHGDARRGLLSPGLGVPSRLWRLKPGLSRASSRSEGRAEAVGVGCRPMLGSYGAAEAQQRQGTAPHFRIASAPTLKTVPWEA